MAWAAELGALEAILADAALVVLIQVDHMVEEDLRDEEVLVEVEVDQRMVVQVVQDCSEGAVKYDSAHEFHESGEQVPWHRTWLQCKSLVSE